MTRTKKTILIASACTLLGITGFVACSSSSDSGTGPIAGSGGVAGSIVPGPDGGGTSGGGGSGGVDASAGYGGQGPKGGSGGGGFPDVSIPPVEGGSFDSPWNPSECAPPEQTPDANANCLEGMNRPGCPCKTKGETAPCFTGEPKNRNRGQCHDGTTVCKQLGELSMIWDDCNGEVLPTPGATTGAPACVCFTYAVWSLENVNFCFWGLPPGSEGVMSDIVKDGKRSCDYDADPMSNPPVLPSQNWTRNILTSDCAGSFKLCYKIMAGNVNQPSSDDCQLIEVCTYGDYATPMEPQQMPDLPAWTSNNLACVQRAWDVGYWGELEVVGQSIECDTVSGRTFKKVAYCPGKCALSENKGLPECQGCGGVIVGDI